MQFRIHWLSITIYCSLARGMAYWDVWFAPFLGALQSSGHGGQGFRNMFVGFLGSRLMGNPAGVREDDLDKQYIHVGLPGKACDAIPDQIFHEFFLMLKKKYNYRVSRLDLAWDEVGFTPQQVKDAIDQQQIRSHASRKTMSFTESAYEKREDGVMGTHSLRLGSLSSNRLLRVYDRRGPTRIELLSRHARATLITSEVLMQPVETWAELAIGHLRDYIDFINRETGELLPWWSAFVSEIERAMKTVSDARQIELGRMIQWIDQQVSCTLSVLQDVYGEDLIQMLISSGKKKRGKRYDQLISTTKTTN